jgi:nucleoside-diphosphate-sugar epimerase
MKKILISGGLGFMGYHLIKSLLKRYSNPYITVIDNLSSSKIDFGDLYSRLNVIINDFQKIDDLNDTFDEIYHLASPVGSLGILKKNGYVVKEIIELTYKAIEFSIGGMRNYSSYQPLKYMDTPESMMRMILKKSRTHPVHVSSILSENTLRKSF